MKRKSQNNDLSFLGKHYKFQVNYKGKENRTRNVQSQTPKPSSGRGAEGPELAKSQKTKHALRERNPRISGHRSLLSSHVSADLFVYPQLCQSHCYPTWEGTGRLTRGGVDDGSLRGIHGTSGEKGKEKERGDGIYP